MMKVAETGTGAEEGEFGAPNSNLTSTPGSGRGTKRRAAAQSKREGGDLEAVFAKEDQSVESGMAAAMNKAAQEAQRVAAAERAQAAIHAATSSNETAKATAAVKAKAPVVKAPAMSPPEGQPAASPQPQQQQQQQQQQPPQQQQQQQQQATATASGQSTFTMVSACMLKCLAVANPHAGSPDWFLPILEVLVDSGSARLAILQSHVSYACGWLIG
jgi:DNA segregation ATPase FtsK/SpoIIIE-like protein